MPLNGLIWQVIQAAATQAGIDPFLAGAVAMQESSWNPAATRFEPQWQYFSDPLPYAVRCGVTVEEEMRAQATSWGLMQVMGSVARELGYRGKLPDLSSATAGARYGSLKLADLLFKYDREDAIASYNAGSPRRNADGTYVNQAYVDKVLGYIAQIKGSLG